ncbi:MAG: hypothetical protein AAB586_02290 [Patescibacteria group bacterium]
MRSLKSKQRIKRLIYSIPLVVILLIIAILLTKGAIGLMGKEIESRKDSKNLEEQMSVLVTRESELKENIRRLETEEGIRDEIREKFNVTQEGELVAVIVDDRRFSSSTDDLSLPWYRKILNVIMSVYE